MSRVVEIPLAFEVAEPATNECLEPLKGKIALVAARSVVPDIGRAFRADTLDNILAVFAKTTEVMFTIEGLQAGFNPFIKEFHDVYGMTTESIELRDHTHGFEAVRTDCGCCG